MNEDRPLVYLSMSLRNLVFLANDVVEDILGVEDRYGPMPEIEDLSRRATAILDSVKIMRAFPPSLASRLESEYAEVSSGVSVRDTRPGPR